MYTKYCVREEVPKGVDEVEAELNRHLHMAELRSATLEHRLDEIIKARACQGRTGGLAWPSGKSDPIVRPCHTHTHARTHKHTRTRTHANTRPRLSAGLVRQAQGRDLRELDAAEGAAGAVWLHIFQAASRQLPGIYQATNPGCRRLFGGCWSIDCVLGCCCCCFCCWCCCVVVVVVVVVVVLSLRRAWPYSTTTRPGLTQPPRGSCGGS
jgi:hypothetical protein